MSKCNTRLPTVQDYDFNVCVVWSLVIQLKMMFLVFIFLVIWILLNNCTLVPIIMMIVSVLLIYICTLFCYWRACLYLRSNMTVCDYMHWNKMHWSNILREMQIFILATWWNINIKLLGIGLMFCFYLQKMMSC